MFLIENTLFGQIWSKKSKLSVEAEILVPRLIPICRIQWWCSLFLFLIGNTFFGQIWSKKIKISSSRWNLILKLIQTCRVQWCCSFFLFFTRNALLGQTWSKLSIFTAFFVFDQKCSLLGKFGPKCQNCQFKVKFAS